MILKKLFFVICIVICLSLLSVGCGQKQVDNNTNNETKIAYPEKTIKLVIMFPAGSGPDGWMRKIAGLMEEKFGYKFEISNDASNSGANAHNTVWNAPHDGYSIFGTSENALAFGIYGLTKQTTKDWATYSIGQAQTIIAVGKDSAYKSLKDLVEAAKAKPESIKVGVTGIGTSFHLKIGLLEKITGAKFKIVPVENEDIGLNNALINKDVDAIIAPTLTERGLIDEGKIIPLSTFELASYDAGRIGQIESITKIYPEAKQYLPIDAAIAFYMPQDVPQDIQQAFGKSFESVLDGPEMAEFHSKVGVQKLNIWGKPGTDYFLRMEKNVAWLAKDMGLAKVDPETLGIQKQ